MYLAYCSALCRIQAKRNKLTGGGSKSNVFIESFTQFSQLADILIYTRFDVTWLALQSQRIFFLLHIFLGDSINA